MNFYVVKIYTLLKCGDRDYGEFIIKINFIYIFFKFYSPRVCGRSGNDDGAVVLCFIGWHCIYDDYGVSFRIES